MKIPTTHSGKLRKRPVTLKNSKCLLLVERRTRLKSDIEEVRNHLSPNLLDKALLWIELLNDIFLQMLLPPQPGLRIRLNMKLQSIDTTSEAKCLLRVLHARRQQDRILGQRKCIAMPMKDWNDFSGLCEKRIMLSQCGQFHCPKSDFWSFPRKYTLPKSLCEQLRTQADSKYGLIVTSELSHEPAFAGKNRMFAVFIGAHWPAHHNQAVNIVSLRNPVSSVKTPHIQTQTTSFRFKANQSWSLPGRVLQNHPTIPHGYNSGTVFPRLQ